MDRQANASERDQLQLVRSPTGRMSHGIAVKRSVSSAKVAIKSRAPAIRSGGISSSSASRIRMAADEVATIATTMTT